MRRPATLMVLLLLPLAPAAADWLEMRDGSLVETRGPWKVKGSLVVFTAMNGALSSLRVSEVDLDASAVATAEAKEPAPAAAEPEPVERPPIAVFTNDDIPRASAPAASAEGEAEPSSEAEGAAAAGPPKTVKVISWRQIENTQIDGVEIHATIQNQGRDIATDLGVTVSLFDEDGMSLGTVNAFLGTISLAPSVTTTVRALFPEVYRFFGEPGFEIRHKTISVRVPVRSADDQR